jgi:hypothetical protein
VRALGLTSHEPLQGPDRAPRWSGHVEVPHHRHRERPGIEAHLRGAHHVVRHAAGPPFEHIPVPVDQEVVADIAPAPAVRVVGVDPAHDVVRLGSGVGVGPGRVVHEPHLQERRHPCGTVHELGVRPPLLPGDDPGATGHGLRRLHARRRLRRSGGHRPHVRGGAPRPIGRARAVDEQHPEVAHLGPGRDHQREASAGRAAGPQVLGTALGPHVLGRAGVGLALGLQGLHSPEASVRSSRRPDLHVTGRTGRALRPRESHPVEPDGRARSSPGRAHRLGGSKGPGRRAHAEAGAGADQASEVNPHRAQDGLGHRVPSGQAGRSGHRDGQDRRHHRGAGQPTADPGMFGHGFGRRRLVCLPVPARPGNHPIGGSSILGGPSAGGGTGTA